MADVIPYFQQQHREYIFPVIEKKLAELQERLPDAAIVNLGIGDVALPLVPTVSDAVCRAVKEMQEPSKIRGYGPSSGYLFLKEAIVSSSFSHLGITPDEIFISEGAGHDTTNIQELFPSSSIVALFDPTYPAYFDALLMGGKQNILHIPCTEELGFCPQPPEAHCDLIYLCSPSNPTGVAMTKKHLSQWVEYALKEEALILFDHAYEAFITSSDVPRSIFEIPGADRCAIEFRSFSKTAGFTGLRCAYTVLPKAVKVRLGSESVSLNPLWERRQSVKTNGVAYPIQRGAEAALTLEGKRETREQITTYLEAAKLLQKGLTAMGHTCFGGIDSPYIWWKSPNGMSSWEFFDHLLAHCHLISVPGRGFGSCGEGFVRLSAFTTLQKATLALERISKTGF